MIGELEDFLINESFIIDHPDTSFDFLPTINITLSAIEPKKQLINTQMTKNESIVPIMIQIINFIKGQHS